MNFITLKTSLYLIITSTFIIMAFIINDAVDSQFLASLSIISGAYANKSLSTINDMKKIK